ncbi:hypothetical protein [Caballeronia glebae]|uniref:hypothetical protein n=1 Tax=Caballeronia glebae TaxID=1777143 RepID=UPI0038BD968B
MRFRNPSLRLHRIARFLLSLIRRRPRDLLRFRSPIIRLRRLRRGDNLFRLRRRRRSRFRAREPPRGEFLLAQSRRFVRVARCARALPRFAQQIFTQLSQLRLRIEGFIGGLRLARRIGT